MSPTSPSRGTAAPVDKRDGDRDRHPSAGAPRPTGVNAPTDPAVAVDPVVQAAMELVIPQPGYVLVRLMLADQRTEELGLPGDTTALLDAAMLRIVAFHSGDDSIARELPVGSVVFASLEGLAPLLVTHVFLLPLDRIQGSFPVADLAGAEPIGFGA